MRSKKYERHILVGSNTAADGAHGFACKAYENVLHCELCHIDWLAELDFFTPFYNKQSKSWERDIGSEHGPNKNYMRCVRVVSSVGVCVKCVWWRESIDRLLYILFLPFFVTITAMINLRQKETKCNIRRNKTKKEPEEDQKILLEAFFFFSYIISSLAL